MIDLTQEQLQALKRGGEPAGKDLYDDSPWTTEEMDLLAVEAGELLDHYGNVA